MAAYIYIAMYAHTYLQQIDHLSLQCFSRYGQLDINSDEQLYPVNKSYHCVKSLRLLNFRY